MLYKTNNHYCKSDHSNYKTKTSYDIKLPKIVDYRDD